MDDDETHVPKHQEALGRFISRFSKMDSYANVAFRMMLKIDDDAGRVIADEKSLPDLLDLFVRVATALKKPEGYVKEITDLKKQVGLMNKIRRVVVHKPFYWDNSNFMFLTQRSAKNPERAFTYRCTIDELHAASDDLDMLTNRFFWLTNPEATEWPAPGTKKYLQQKASRDKRPRPTDPATQPRTTRELRQRQRQPSRKSL